MSAGTIFLLLAAGVVLMRCACVASHLTPRKWGARRIQYAAFAGSLAALGAGALGVALHWQPAGIMLLIGAAGVILFDRRTPRA